MKKPSTIVGTCMSIAFGALVLLGLYLASLYSYLLFHSLAELFSIVVACGIFLVAWNARKIMDNNHLLFLGVAYLFIAGMDLAHTLAYTGMNVFPQGGTNLPTQLWIAARYMEGISLLIAPLVLGRKLRAHDVLFSYAAVSCVLLAAIFYVKVFPDCFIEGMGLTAFKKTSEYVISLILVGSICLLYQKREKFDTHVLKLIVASVIVTIFSELAFTLYRDAYGLANLSGHFLKLVSFYLIYKAVIETGLTRPYDILFRNLKQGEQDLKNTVAELKVANEELEAFAYSVSHDLRAPLRNMDGFSQALLEDHADKLDEKGKRYIQRIRAGSQRMGELIDDLLQLSRLTRMEMTRERVDLSAMVKTTATELQQSEPERKAEFAITPGLFATGDEHLLRVAIENMLGNAWKFTSKHTDARIEFGARKDNGKTVYFVRDNGAGFDMANADKLFDAFQRLHSPDEFEGAGIGPATVQRVIHRHGGSVWAESTIEQGATFYFTL